MALKTTSAYADVRRRGGAEAILRAARDAAAKEWNGSDWSEGERADAEHRLLWPSDWPLGPGREERFDSLALRVWAPLLGAEGAMR
jgi:hypothetical protein